MLAFQVLASKSYDKKINAVSLHYLLQQLANLSAIRFFQISKVVD